MAFLRQSLIVCGFAPEPAITALSAFTLQFLTTSLWNMYQWPENSLSSKYDLSAFDLDFKKMYKYSRLIGTAYTVRQAKMNLNSFKTLAFVAKALKPTQILHALYPLCLDWFLTLPLLSFTFWMTFGVSWRLGLRLWPKKRIF